MDLKGSIVLDLGCGCGVYSLDAAKSVARYVVALDIDYDSLKNASAR